MVFSGAPQEYLSQKRRLGPLPRSRTLGQTDVVVRSGARSVTAGPGRPDLRQPSAYRVRPQGGMALRCEYSVFGENR